MLKRLLGERNCSDATLHSLVENRFAAATLYGKLANLAGDLDSKWLESTATFKAITGGDSLQDRAQVWLGVLELQPVGTAVLLG